ncbi:methyltransferase [candidate division KSB3 bacterium]|uniref:Methyltransferase n=1 Tax=candidate division KSB3 bacterium TaxID=2044937 RepID=A0A9D5Q4R9_9BACT|nr:methyltransferase [candidate division KSB3 bacterium]MBD3323472.1 methyltransferase [candidate division KSB3 bacterium]
MAGATNLNRKAFCFTAFLIILILFVLTPRAEIPDFTLRIFPKFFQRMVQMCGVFTLSKEESMTSRERILCAIAHQEPDRVPIDIGAMRSTGISTIAYNRLVEALGLNDGPSRMYDFQQQLAYPSQAVRDRFHVDAIDAGQAFLAEAEAWRPWTLNDGSTCVVPKYLNLERDAESNIFLKNAEGVILGQQPTSSLYTDQAYWHYGDLPTIPEHIDDADLSMHMWAIPCPPFHLDMTQEADYALFIEKIRHLHETTDYAIMLSIGHSLFEVGSFLRKIDNFLVDIYTDRQSANRLLDKLVDKYMLILERILNGVKEYVDIIQFGDDLGIQRGPWMDPDVIKEVFIPRYKKMWDYVHAQSDCKIFFHSCGSVYKVIPLLIDAGLDILNPVQTNTADMEPERLKQEFGKDLTFWGGGCDTHHILPHGTPEEVREDVKRRIDIFAKGGGFVFNQIHNVLADVPPENIIAMYDAAYEYGWYR